MALQYASDKERILITDLVTKNPKVRDEIRLAWGRALRENRYQAFFQLLDNDCRFMFLLRADEMNPREAATIHYIAQQNLYKRSGDLEAALANILS